MNLFAAWAPMIGLIFFFIVFVVVAARAYRPSAKAQLQLYAYIPLKETEND